MLTSINFGPLLLAVGVKQGDWIEYHVTFTGTLEPNHSIVAANMTILAVQGDAIKVNILSTYLNGTQVSSNATLNLQTGQLIDNYIIPANLAKGDQFYDSNVGNVTIASVEQKTYAGATRSVITATVYYSNGNTTYVWDQATGVSVEGISINSAYTMHTIANATNMWQPQSSRFVTSTSPLVIVGAIFVVIVIVVAGVLLRLRKKLIKK